MERPKRLKELCLQLSVTFDLDIFAVQPNFLTGGVAPRSDSLIVSALLKFLGMIEIFLANNYQLSEFRWQFVRRLEPGAGVNIFFIWHPRMVATIQVKRRMTGASILSIVVSEFRYW